jgi:hypothetical protein
MVNAHSQNRKRVAILLGIALLLAVVAVANLYWDGRSHPSASEWRTPADTEQVWVVRSLLKEVGRFAAFAANRESDLWREDAVEVTGTALVDGVSWFRVRVLYGQGRTWETEIPVESGEWHTDTYADFTRELLTKAKATAAAKTYAGSRFSTIGTLTSPRAEVFQAENERISAWLAAAPLDPQAHEEAALLAGTLAWRDSSGLFRDPRDLCARAKAHLIIGHALRGHSQSEVGALGELMVGLAARMGDNEARLRQLAAHSVSSPELTPWINMAEIALGHDWHPVALANNPTLLERIELFRGICRTEGTANATADLGRHQFEDVADWTRILFEHEFNGQIGRQFSRFALAFEKDESTRVFPELAGQPLQSPAFAKLLNTPVEPTVTGAGPASAQVRVLDAGLWGHYLQRHLCHTICRTGDHLRKTAAIPEAANAFFQSSAVICRHLKLVPMAAVASGDAEWLQSAGPAVATILKQHPDWVTPTIWNSFLRQAPKDVTRGLPQVAQWVGPAQE